MITFADHHCSTINVIHVEHLKTKDFNLMVVLDTNSGDQQIKQGSFSQDHKCSQISIYPIFPGIFETGPQ